MTTGFQFAHIQWFGKIGSSKRQFTESTHGSQRGKGWSAADILAEAGRVKGHCSHVDDPQQPTLIYGLPLNQVEGIADNWAKHQATKVTSVNGKISTRKMRSDAPTLVSGVISFPKERIAEWPAFRDHAIAQLKQKYSERLISVVEHLDETHPHLHFYLVPNIDEPFGAVHAGYAASRAARKSKGNLIRSSFKEAMRKWQDWIQESIAAPFGLARIGPRRARETNARWKSDEAKRLLKLREAAARQREGDLAKKEANLMRREALILNKEQAIESANIAHTQLMAAQFIDLIKEKTKAVNEVAENVKIADKLKAVLAAIEPEVKQILIERIEFLQQYVPDEWCAPR